LICRTHLTSRLVVGGHEDELEHEDQMDKCLFLHCGALALATRLLQGEAVASAWSGLATRPQTRQLLPENLLLAEPTTRNTITRSALDLWVELHLARQVDVPHIAEVPVEDRPDLPVRKESLV